MEVKPSTSPDEPQTPRVDREVYRVSARDIGFEVVNPSLARQLELELRGSHRIIDELGVELRMAQEELEHKCVLLENERMKVAGCSTAATGYWKDGDSISSSYDCAAIHDVALLYAKYVKAQERCAQAYEEAAEVCENHAIYVSNTEDAYATCVNCAREIRALAAIKP